MSSSSKRVCLMDCEDESLREFAVDLLHRYKELASAAAAADPTHRATATTSTTPASPATSMMTLHPAATATSMAPSSSFSTSAPSSSSSSIHSGEEEVSLSEEAFRNVVAMVVFCSQADRTAAPDFPRPPLLERWLGKGKKLALKHISHSDAIAVIGYTLNAVATSLTITGTAPSNDDMLQLHDKLSSRFTLAAGSNANASVGNSSSNGTPSVSEQQTKDQQARSRAKATDEMMKEIKREDTTIDLSFCRRVTRLTLIRCRVVAIKGARGVSELCLIGSTLLPPPTIRLSTSLSLNRGDDMNQGAAAANGENEKRAVSWDSFEHLRQLRCVDCLPPVFPVDPHAVAIVGGTLQSIYLVNSIEEKSFIFARQTYATSYDISSQGQYGGERGSGCPPASSQLLQQQQQQQQLVSRVAWQSLTEVNLSGNRLTELTPSWAGLRELRKLDLSENCLECLDPVLRQCVHLHTVSVRHNNLVNVTNAVHCIPNVRLLDVSYNSVTSLLGLTFLPELQVLNVSYNKLAFWTDLTSLQEHCTKLASISFLGNPLGQLVYRDDVVRLGYTIFSLRKNVRINGVQPAVLSAKKQRELMEKYGDLFMGEGSIVGFSRDATLQMRWGEHAGSDATAGTPLARAHHHQNQNQNQNQHNNSQHQPQQEQQQQHADPSTSPQFVKSEGSTTSTTQHEVTKDSIELGDELKNEGENPEDAKPKKKKRILVKKKVLKKKHQHEQSASEQRQEQAGEVDEDEAQQQHQQSLVPEIDVQTLRAKYGDNWLTVYNDIMRPYLQQQQQQQEPRIDSFRSTASTDSSKNASPSRKTSKPKHDGEQNMKRDTLGDSADTATTASTPSSPGNSRPSSFRGKSSTTPTPAKGSSSKQPPQPPSTPPPPPPPLQLIPAEAQDELRYSQLVCRSLDQFLQRLHQECSSQWRQQQQNTAAATATVTTASLLLMSNMGPAHQRHEAVATKPLLYPSGVTFRTFQVAPEEEFLAVNRTSDPIVNAAAKARSNSSFGASAAAACEDADHIKRYTHGNIWETPCSSSRPIPEVWLCPNHNAAATTAAAAANGGNEFGGAVGNGSFNSDSLFPAPQQHATSSAAPGFGGENGTLAHTATGNFNFVAPKASRYEGKWLMRIDQFHNDGQVGFIIKQKHITAAANGGGGVPGAVVSFSKPVLTSLHAAPASKGHASENLSFTNVEEKAAPKSGGISHYFTGGGAPAATTSTNATGDAKDSGNGHVEITQKRNAEGEWVTTLVLSRARMLELHSLISAPTQPQMQCGFVLHSQDAAGCLMKHLRRKFSNFRDPAYVPSSADWPLYKQPDKLLHPPLVTRPHAERVICLVRQLRNLPANAATTSPSATMSATDNTSSSVTAMTALNASHNQSVVRQPSELSFAAEFSAAARSAPASGFASVSSVGMQGAALPTTATATSPPVSSSTSATAPLPLLLDMIDPSEKPENFGSMRAGTQFRVHPHEIGMYLSSFLIPREGTLMDCRVVGCTFVNICVGMSEKSCFLVILSTHICILPDGNWEGCAMTIEEAFSPILTYPVEDIVRLYVGFGYSSLELDFGPGTDNLLIVTRCPNVTLRVMLHLFEVVSVNFVEIVQLPFPELPAVFDLSTSLKSSGKVENVTVIVQHCQCFAARYSKDGIVFLSYDQYGGSGSKPGVKRRPHSQSLANRMRGALFGRGGEDATAAAASASASGATAAASFMRLSSNVNASRGRYVDTATAGTAGAAGGATAAHVTFKTDMSGGALMHDEGAAGDIEGEEREGEEEQEAERGEMMEEGGGAAPTAPAPQQSMPNVNANLPHTVDDMFSFRPRSRFTTTQQQQHANTDHSDDSKFNDAKDVYPLRHLTNAVWQHVHHGFCATTAVFTKTSPPVTTKAATAQSHQQTIPLLQQQQQQQQQQQHSILYGDVCPGDRVDLHLLADFFEDPQQLVERYDANTQQQQSAPLLLSDAVASTLRERILVSFSLLAIVWIEVAPPFSALPLSLVLVVESNQCVCVHPSIKDDINAYSHAIQQKQQQQQQQQQRHQQQQGGADDSSVAEHCDDTLYQRWMLVFQHPQALEHFVQQLERLHVLCHPEHQGVAKYRLSHKAEQQQEQQRQQQQQHEQPQSGGGGSAADL